MSGGAAPCVLNAANEIAVAAFLRGEIGFTDIARVVEYCLSQSELISGSPKSIEELLNLDNEVRKVAEIFSGSLKR